MSRPLDSPEVLERFHSALDLVDAIARQLQRTVGRKVDFGELQSFGREGLLVASRRYDAERGVPFRAYASYRVRGAMIDGMRRFASLPRRVHELLRGMEAADRYAEGVAEDVLGTSPPPQQSRKDAERMLDEHLAGMATAMAAGLVSSAAVSEQGELTAVDEEPSPESKLRGAELRQVLADLIQELPREERELVHRHYFLGERFDHVARDLGLSKSWASRIHSRAVARLGKRMRAVS